MINKNFHTSRKGSFIITYEERKTALAQSRIDSRALLLPPSRFFYSRYYLPKTSALSGKKRTFSSSVEIPVNHQSSLQETKIVVFELPLNSIM